MGGWATSCESRPLGNSCLLDSDVLGLSIFFALAFVYDERLGLRYPAGGGEGSMGTASDDVLGGPVTATDDGEGEYRVW